MTGVQTCALPIFSPIDQKFFELIVPIATFLTGTLSGIMLAGNDKDLRAQAIQAATKSTPVSPTPMPPVSVPFTPSPISSPAPAAITVSSTSGINIPVTQPVAAFTPQVVMSSTGKPMPVQPPQPEI